MVTAANDEEKREVRQIKRLELDPRAAVQGLAPGTREAVQELFLNPEPRFPYLSDGNNNKTCLLEL